HEQHHMTARPACEPQSRLNGPLPCALAPPPTQLFLSSSRRVPRTALQPGGDTVPQTLSVQPSNSPGRVLVPRVGHATTRVQPASSQFPLLLAIIGGQFLQRPSVPSGRTGFILLCGLNERLVSIAAHKLPRELANHRSSNRVHNAKHSQQQP